MCTRNTKWYAVVIWIRSDSILVPGSCWNGKIFAMKVLKKVTCMFFFCHWPFLTAIYFRQDACILWLIFIVATSKKKNASAKMITNHNLWMLTLSANISFIPLNLTVRGKTWTLLYYSSISATSLMLPWHVKHFLSLYGCCLTVVLPVLDGLKGP